MLAAPAVGSFIGLVVDRFETTRGVVAPGSRCDRCDRPLAPQDLVPIVSWLVALVWRGGRSRCCGRPLRLFHPFMEGAALGLAVRTVWETAGAVRFATAGLGWMLLCLSAIDVKSFRLPDWGTLSLVLAGLGLATAGMTGPPIEHALGAALGYAALAAIGWGYRRWRGVDGLGLGDAKLFAAAGAWLGVFGLASTLLIGAATGLAIALALSLVDRRRELGRRMAIPFGPALAAGFWITWLYGPITLG